MKYLFTIEPGDVSGAPSHRPERFRLLAALGRILPCDIGKRVYEVSDGCGRTFYQVENDEQRDERIQREKQTR